MSLPSVGKRYVQTLRRSGTMKSQRFIQSDHCR